MKKMERVECNRREQFVVSLRTDWFSYRRTRLLGLFYGSQTYNLNLKINQSDFLSGVSNRATSKPLRGFRHRVKLRNNVRIRLMKQVAWQASHYTTARDSVVV